MEKTLEDKLMKTVLVPEKPQITGALGCSIYGSHNNQVV